MRFILGLFIFLPQFGHALEISKRDGRLYLLDSCAEALSEYNALSRWNQKSQTGKTCGPPRSISQERACLFDITNCVPDHVVTYHGAKPEISGPNCWNLSLVMSNILPALRYTTNQEMSFYMGPPLCRQLVDGEAKEPGDVGAIRQINPDGSLLEMHGFIYISEDLAYSKNGMSRTSPYALQSLNMVYQTYGVPAKSVCRKNEMSSTVDCLQSVSYFRCDSMENYLDKNAHIPQEIRDTFASLDSVEQCLQNSIFTKSALTPEAERNIVDTSAALLNYLETAKSSPERHNLKADEWNFLIGSLQLRLKSISTQIRYMSEEFHDIAMGEKSSEIHEFAKALDDSKKSLTGTK